MYQKTTIIGRVGQITPAATANGVIVSNISVVTTKSLKQDDGSFKEYEEWHRIVAFNKPAEFYNSKVEVGSLLLIDDLELRTRKYRKDGEATDRYVTELVANSFPKKLPRFYTKEQTNGQAQPQRQAPAPQAPAMAPAPGYEDMYDDDIPM